MNNFELLMQGFATALSLVNLTVAIGGGILGLLIGATPGLGGVTGVALLLPLTFKMDPTTAIIFLAAIYFGNMYGGAYSAILLNIPGDSPAVMTAMDGYPMSQQGKGGKALFAANLSSFVGGTVGIITLTVFGPVLANIGLKFGPAEITALILLALTSIGWLLGEEFSKGIVAAALGILLSTIGIDSMAGGMPRYTFGTVTLMGGISFIPLVIGMFGMTQVMELMKSKENDSLTTGKRLSVRESLLDRTDVKRISLPVLKGSILGNFIGFLPGAGGTAASFLAYVFDKKTSKHGKDMGKGMIEGVAVSESANNAAAVGAFVPLLCLGIPGSATAVVLFGGLMMWGLQPGPLLFAEQPEFVWGLIGSMYIGNVACIAIGLMIIPFLMSILKIPKGMIAPMIVVICIVGAYSINNSMFDVWFMIGAGVIAFIMKNNNYPIPPILLAFVLAPMFEQSIRRAFTISNGSPLIFFQKPISAVLLAMTLVFLLSPLLVSVVSKIKNKKNEEMN
jgi:putative tricarboxylic transport membrane protein